MIHFIKSPVLRARRHQPLFAAQCPKSCFVTEREPCVILRRKMTYQITSLPRQAPNGPHPLRVCSTEVRAKASYDEYTVQGWV